MHAFHIILGNFNVNLYILLFFIIFIIFFYYYLNLVSACLPPSRDRAEGPRELICYVIYVCTYVCGMGFHRRGVCDTCIHWRG